MIWHFELGCEEHKMLIWNIVGLVWISVGAFAMSKEKNIINPVTIMCSIWGTIDILSSMQLYGLYEAKDEAYGYINLGVAFFLVGCVAARLKIVNRQKVKGSITISPKQYQLRERRCFLILIVCLMFLGYKVIQYRSAIFKSGLSLGAIQTSIGKDSTSVSGILNAIYFLIINPMMLALPTAVISDYYVRKKNIMLLVLCVALCVLRVMTSGGRQAFIQIFFYIFVALYFSKDAVRKKIGKIKQANQKKKMRVAILGAFIVLLLLTISRTSAVIKTIYLDFAMQPKMLEIWTDKIQKVGKNSYGIMALLGYIYPACYIIKNLLGLNGIPQAVQSAYDMRMATMSEWVSIGPNLIANAYVTCFWYFYHDAGVLGIIMGMSLCGYISCKIYRKVKRNPTSKNVCSYMFVAMAIFYTFGDFYPSNPYFIIGYLYAQKLLFKSKG